MRRTLEVVGLNGNGAIGRVSALLPMSLDLMVYDWVDPGGNATPADITELREFLNTEPIRLYTGTDQDNMNKLDRMAGFAGDVLRIPNELVGMKSVDATYSTTRNTLSQDPDTGNAITNGRVDILQTIAETWRLFVEADDAILGGPGGITRFQKVAVQNPAGFNGEWSLQNQLVFGSPEKRFLRRLLALVSAGDFLNGDAFIQRGVNNDEIYRRTKVFNDRVLQDYNVRSLPALYSASSGFVIDSTETGIGEMFDTMRVATAAEIKAGVANLSNVKGVSLLPQSTFNIRFSPSQAGTGTVLAETLGRL